jgi:hypothetical protein
MGARRLRRLRFLSGTIADPKYAGRSFLVSKQPEKKPPINPPDREAIIKKQADTVKALKRIPETRYEEGSVLSVAVTAKFAQRLKSAYCGSGAHIGEERPLPLGNDFLISLLMRGIQNEEWRQEHIKRKADPAYKETKWEWQWRHRHAKLLFMLETQGPEALHAFLLHQANIKHKEEKPDQSVDTATEEQVLSSAEV